MNLGSGVTAWLLKRDPDLGVEWSSLWYLSQVLYEGI